MAKRRKDALWHALLPPDKHRVPEEHWPKAPDHRFERMSDGLKIAVGAAVQSVTRAAEIAEWKWEPYEQKFTFQVATWMTLHEVNTSVLTRMSLDPALEWASEIERVMAEAEKFVREVRKKLGCEDD